MEKLLPCPFCGGEATWKLMFMDDKNGEDRAIECSKCRAEVNCINHKQAIKVWNTRTNIM